MARPTTDPKPKILTVRLSTEDLKALKRLAKEGKCSLGEAMRRLLRGQTASPVANPTRKGRLTSFRVFPKDIPVLEQKIACLEHGAKVLSRCASELEAKAPDDETDATTRVWKEIGLIWNAVSFLSTHAQATKPVLAKAKADAEAP
jgi:hypothetical protein